jgi:hypothetical protein
MVTKGMCGWEFYLRLVLGLSVPSSGLECGSETEEFEREGFGSEVVGTVVSQFSHVSRELEEARLALTEGGFMDFLEGLRCRTVAGLDSCSLQNELPISRYAISSAVEGAGERESVRRLPVVALLFKGCVLGEGFRLLGLGCGTGVLEDGFGERDCVREVVPLMPSSPTVACLKSSIKVHKPSRKSEAILLPVLSRTSRGKPKSMASSAVRTTSVVKSASVGTRVGCGGRAVSDSGRGGACGRGGGERIASGDSRDKARA